MEPRSAASLLVVVLVTFCTPSSPNLDWDTSNDVTGWNFTSARKPEIRDDPEIHMDVCQIIRYHGYPAEQHNVTTKDGYILTIHRIPHGKKTPPTPGPRPPVLVQHGLLCSSAIWVVNTPDKNLPYLLADSGYDVWLGNVRGNTYGRHHVSLSPKQKEFWMFSFDEMAHYDLPAVIDFLLNATGFNSTFYVGHSMGTTIPLALLSSWPQYNDKIRSVMALAPVATCTHIRSPIRYLEPFAYDLALAAEMFGDYELLPNNSRVIKFFSRTVCTWPIKALCTDLLFLLFGFDSAQFNATRLPVYLSHIPAGASVQTVLHYAQMGLKDGFWYFDYGAKGNMEKYGQPTPPEYNVSKITTPVAVFWGENDYLADEQDVDELTRELRSLVVKYKVPYKPFNHADFAWAIDVKPLLYNKVLSVMAKLARKG